MCYYYYAVRTVKQQYLMAIKKRVFFLWWDFLSSNTRQPLGFLYSFVLFAYTEQLNIPSFSITKFRCKTFETNRRKKKQHNYGILVNKDGIP